MVLLLTLLGDVSVTMFGVLVSTRACFDWVRRIGNSPSVSEIIQRTNYVVQCYKMNKNVRLSSYS